MSDVQNLFRKEARSLHPFAEVPVPLQELENGLLGVRNLDLGSELTQLSQVKRLLNLLDKSLASPSINQQALICSTD